MTDVSTVDTPREKEPAPPAAQAPDDGPRGLPRPTFFFILALVVTLFLLVRGPVWRHPWDAAALDAAIFWSYLPIPFLVTGGLLLARRFSWRFLFLESMVIVLVKYAITFSMALVFWAVNGLPPPPPKAPPPAKTAVVTPPPPPPTKIAPEQTGVARGVVKDASGKPVAGAFVYVASGLEAFVFAPPDTPVRVENDGKSVRASSDADAALKLPAGLVVARAGQTIQGRSLDAHLHTLVASGDGAGTTFNIPMMSSGVWSSVVVREPAKVSRLKCTVHPEGEAPGYLVVLDHPFYAATAADGAFRIEGIPAAKIALAAWHPTSGAATTDVTITAREGATSDLTLAPPPR
jgi:hypothetical protein